MAKLIDKRTPIAGAGVAKIGEVREDEDGRIVMVIRNERWDELMEEVDDSVLKLLTLEEGIDGNAEPFKTIPCEDYTAEEVARLYPKLLDVDIVIRGVK